ncbi:MAG: hypothetical protein ABI616_11145 [Pseudomonadota bacterium]
MKNLRLPVFASGKTDISATLKSAGKLTALNLNASTGDLSMHVAGRLGVLRLRDSDLTVNAEAADASRLAQVFNIKGVPPEKLSVKGRVITKSSGITLEGVHATLGGYEGAVDGTLPARRNRARQLRFSLTVPSLADIRTPLPPLPPLPLSVSGEVQYKAQKSLLSSRDIQLDLTGVVGNSRFTAKGGFARLDPMEGADFALTVSNPDGGALLEKLRLPVIATGRLDMNATLKQAGNLTDLVLDAQLGDVTAHASGKVARLGLQDSDLTFRVEAADPARIARAFDMANIPAGKLTANGRMLTTDMEYKFAGVHVALGAITAQLDGTIPTQRERATQLHIDLAAPNVADLKAGLPPLPLRLSAAVSRQPDRLQLTDINAQLGATRLRGSLALIGKQPRSIEANLDAAVLDLTPFQPPGTKSPQTKPPARKSLLFDEQQLPYAKLGKMKVQGHLLAGEIRLNRGVLHQVGTTLALDNGRLNYRIKARGGFGGSIDGSMELTPVGSGSATMKVDLTLKDVRTGFAGGESVAPEEVPPLGLTAQLTSTGATPHQLASAVTSTVLLTQGRGKSKSGIMNTLGSDILRQLFTKLNPFAEHDPYTQIECSVLRVVVNNGKAVAAPMLLQTHKVAITANGTVDLHTEKLQINFNTRPREGIGISPGMFTNPFLELTGTLAHPSIGVGTKGVTSGALAAATGGISVVAKGVVDRVIGETNQCKAP